MRKMFFVTNRDVVRRSEFEKKIKDLYLSDNKKISLTFLHNETTHDIAEKSRQKKPDAMIFDDSVSPGQVVSIRYSVIKRLNESSPRFIHISSSSIIDGVSIVESHKEAKNLLLRDKKAVLS